MRIKCRKCSGWEDCPIRQGIYCVPVRKVRKQSRRKNGHS